jgi:radical SAM superfamily enzyme YgiQ (UPF0313 family)
MKGTQDILPPMLRVLIIAANQERLPDPIPPIGAAYVAAAVRARGHEPRIFDACFSKDFEQDLAAAIDDFRPQVIGLSIRNVDNVAFPAVISYLERYRKMANTCRSHAPETPLVLGGSGFSLFPEEFLEELGADYGITGEGEDVFCQKLDEFERHGTVSGEEKLIHSRAMQNLNTMPPPALDLLDIPRYSTEGGSVNIQTKRGCPYLCTYCSYPVLEGRGIRARDPELVVDEIERALRDYETEYFFFVDNVFNNPSGHAAEICESILRRNLKIRWTAYVSPACGGRELFELMRRSGCQSLDFGTDSFCDPQLERLGKSFDVAKVFDISRWCTELGIKFSHSLIFGGPGESWDTIEETVGNTLRSRANAVIAMLGVRIYRETPIAHFVVSRGLLTEKQIGIDPVFYLEDTVHDGLPEYFAELGARYPNWIVPGIGKGLNPRFFQRVRARGVRGPLWELFEAGEEGVAPTRPSAADRVTDGSCIRRMPDQTARP